MACAPMQLSPSQAAPISAMTSPSSGAAWRLSRPGSVGSLRCNAAGQRRVQHCGEPRARERADSDVSCGFPRYNGAGSRRSLGAALRRGSSGFDATPATPAALRSGGDEVLLASASSPSIPGAASGSGAAAAWQAQAQAQAQGQATQATEESGLDGGVTLASLKHLRRQCDTLAREREELLAEVGRLRTLLQQRCRERLPPAPERSAAEPPRDREPPLLDASVAVPVAAEDPSRIDDEASRLRLILQEQKQGAELELQRLRGALEHQRLESEQTLERLRAELEEQRQTADRALQDQRLSLEAQHVLCREQLRTAERELGESHQRCLARKPKDEVQKQGARCNGMQDRINSLEQTVERLRERQRELEEARNGMERQLEEWRQGAGAEAARAAKAERELRTYRANAEELRVSLLASAVNMQLNVCIPEVTLSYESESPFTVSLASAFGDDFVRKFVGELVLPHLQPIWLRVDRSDGVPEGTSETLYSQKLLSMLTSAVEEHVARSRRRGSPRSSSSSAASVPAPSTGASSPLRGSSSPLRAAGGASPLRAGSSSAGAQAVGPAGGAAGRGAARSGWRLARGGS
eukprot:TRINITY_DN28159_c0_g1_i8.p1 TRINITY_DN28159_c0_g1~~TRINITY_DN28159_c0_g1_i8.p1  ORF type:complete len:581 (-),score=151.76 TRINITY_DN28159_c0_g1_i8:304-2046(-)